MYTDADCGGDLDKLPRGGRYSRMASCMNWEAVMWGSKLQAVVATSTSKAENIAGGYAAKEVLWLRKVLGDIYRTASIVDMCCDNQSTLHLMTHYTAGVSG
jgi:hypothetical protein